jgi:hypothetical protein
VRGATPARFNDSRPVQHRRQRHSHGVNVDCPATFVSFGNASHFLTIFVTTWQKTPSTFVTFTQQCCTSRGIDHSRLIFPHQELDKRLTGVEPSRVVTEILS